jgi:hypothetical protein
MRARKLARLIGQSVARAPRPFALSIFGITVGIAALSFFLALSLGMRERVLHRIFPADRVEVVPAKTSLAEGALGALDTLGSLLGAGPRPLDDAVIAELRRHPDVAAVFPRMKVAFPVRGWGGEKLIGRTVYMELIIDGIDPQAVTEKTAPLEFRDYESDNNPFCTEDKNCPQGMFCSWDKNKCEPPVPALISPFLMELYNGSIAKMHGLPRLTGFLVGQLRGMTATAELGRSFVQRGHNAGTARMRHLMLVGVSDRAMPVGLTVPLSYVQRWNAMYSGERASREYSSLSVQCKPGHSPTRVVDLVRKLGYTIEDSGAEQAGLAVTLITALFVLVSLSTLIVAAGSVTHTFFRAISERRHELGVMRAVGASALDIFFLLLGEAALIGLAGGALGLLLARLSALGIDYLSRTALPDFPFKPTSYFIFSAGLCALSVGFSVLTCLLGALFPARAAARLSPSAALSSRL